MGVKTVRLRDDRGGGVVGALMVDPDDELILMSVGGVLIRTPVEEIAIQGRDTSGVRVMNVGEADEVAAVALAPSATDDDLDPPALAPGEDAEPSPPSS